MRRETVLGLAAAGGLVLVMLTVFTYGLAVYEPARFDVVWNDTENTESVHGASLAADASRPHAFEADGTNVTHVRVVLEWDDPVGPDNDVFDLSVDGPGGQSNTASGASGRLALDFTVDSVPDQASVEGANFAHALEQLARPDDLWEGMATWDVVVLLVSADGDDGTLGAGIDAQEDDGNDYSLKFTRVATDATLMPR